MTAQVHTIPAMPEPGSAPAKSMVWIPGGEFSMGSNDFYPEERPVHRVAVTGCRVPPLCESDRLPDLG